MATTYRKRSLDEPQTSTPLDFLRGRTLMRRARASAVHAQGDRVLTHGRRILATVGLHGSSQWHVSDAALSDPPVQPDPTDDRLCVQTPAFSLTPGHFIRAVVLANPSGQTAFDDGEFISATGNIGRVRIAAVYTNSGGPSVGLAEIDIPASPLENAAQPTGGGAAWTQFYRVRSKFILPNSDLKKAANLAAWSSGVTVAISVAYGGAPRAVDVVIYEEPISLAFDLSDDMIVPLHANGVGGSLGQLPGPVPVTRRSATDPCSGTEVVADSAAWLAQSIGPVLFSMTAWSESEQDFTATETDYRSITGTTYTDLVSGSTAAYDADKAGWSASSGANAGRVQENSTVVLRDKTNVVPVRCFVYGAMSTASGSPTATVRFETADHSIVEVAIPSGTSYAWRSATGHLRCGLGAQDPSSLQVRAKCSTATGSPEFRWRYIAVVFEDL